MAKTSMGANVRYWGGKQTLVSWRPRALALPVMALADWTYSRLPQIHANRAAYDGVVAEGGLAGETRARRIVERTGDTP